MGTTVSPTGRKLRLSTGPLYQLLRDGRIAEFNAQKAAGMKEDLTACDFRNVDLKGLDADGLDLSDGYFRLADLRGIDFRHCRLEGASLNGAKVSGAFFPPELSAEEILLSITHGIRLRYRP
jgi:uncharacterized protein YjbI with pentapeptide repeats